MNCCFQLESCELPTQVVVGSVYDESGTPCMDISGLPTQVVVVLVVVGSVYGE